MSIFQKPMMWVSFIASVKQHWTTSLYWHLFSIFQPSIFAVGKTPRPPFRSTWSAPPSGPPHPSGRRCGGQKLQKVEGFQLAKIHNIMMDMMGWKGMELPWWKWMEYGLYHDGNGWNFLSLDFAQIFQRWARFPWNLQLKPAGKRLEKQMAWWNCLEVKFYRDIFGPFVAVLVCFNGRFCEKQC